MMVNPGHAEMRDLHGFFYDRTLTASSRFTKSHESFSANVALARTTNLLITHSID